MMMQNKLKIFLCMIMPKNMKLPHMSFLVWIITGLLNLLLIYFVFNFEYVFSIMHINSHLTIYNINYLYSRN